MDPRLITAGIVVIGIPAVLIGYILGAERVLLLLPARRQPALRPWLWIAPALLFLLVFLVYPMLNTVVLSFEDKFGRQFVGLANYQYFFSSPNTLTALRNNVLWLVLFTGITVGGGLLIAVLLDRVRYESLAKSAVFVPLAISASAAGIIWKFMYDWQPAGTAQTGTVNAIVTALGGEPVAWLQTEPLNNLALIVVGAWMWTGFCMVILSAALKSISPELLEAARVDGATEWQVFRSIILPLLTPAIAVVGTTMVITVLKMFDIVFVMTNGNYGTEVIANRMYKELFSVNHVGRASAVAVVLLLAIVPVMAFNIRQFRAQEEIR